MKSLKSLKSNIEQYVDADDTCEEVEKYFEEGNSPTGDYYKLAKYFREDKDAEPEKVDEAYRVWLRELIDSGRESESIVLTELKRKYNTKPKMEEFVFNLSNLDPKKNQKWHYFISYWGLREFITRDNKWSRKFRQLTIRDGELCCYGDQFSCPELKLWVNAQKQK